MQNKSLKPPSQNMCELRNARNIMTSRYVCKWKWVCVNNHWIRIIRMRLVLRGFMDTEAYSLETYSGTAKRTSQRILASEAACHPDYIIASLDVDKAFLKGFTYKELAEATGEQEIIVCFKLPPGSAAILRTIKGYEHYDESKHCLRNTKPGTGTKDAPRAFSLKLRQTTKNLGLKSTSYDQEFEIKPDLRTAKHVDDINMTGVEHAIDRYTKHVEDIFGKCKVHKHEFTNCGIRHKKLPNGDVTLHQEECIKTLRPIVTLELTGKPPEDPATKLVADQFASLRGALAYTVLTQDWIKVYVVALQRVQHPTNLQVRRPDALTRKLQNTPQTLRFPAMECLGKCDLHSDSGYRRLTGEGDEEKGYGMRGVNAMRRGQRDDGKGEAVHLIYSECKSHRLKVRCSYGVELLVAAHGTEDAFPTTVTLHECKHGVLSPEQLKHVR